MNRIMKSRLLFAAGVLGALQASSASAGTATGNLGVTATVSANCAIGTAPVSFGAYDPMVANLSAVLNGTGTITTTCTIGAAPKITLAQGANAGGGSTGAAPVRQMANGSSKLGYALYSDSERSVAWGNTVATSPSSVAGSGVAQNFTVYGQIAAGQNIPTGAYADIVVATVTF